MIIISPLNALMQDMSDGLKRHGLSTITLSGKSVDLDKLTEGISFSLENVAFMSNYIY